MLPLLRYPFLLPIPPPSLSHAASSLLRVVLRGNIWKKNPYTTHEMYLSVAPTRRTAEGQGKATARKCETSSLSPLPLSRRPILPVSYSLGGSLASVPLFLPRSLFLFYANLSALPFLFLRSLPLSSILHTHMRLTCSGLRFLLDTQHRGTPPQDKGCSIERPLEGDRVAAHAAAGGRLLALLLLQLLHPLLFLFLRRRRGGHGLALLNHRQPLPRTATATR